MPLAALPLLLAELTQAAPPRARAVRAPSAPILDGRLDDAAWREAPVQRGFVQKFPRERETPVGDTSFRVVYDSEALYVGIDCVQPVPIVKNLTRRDRYIESDWVSVGIDARGDGRSAIELTVNAAGVLSDAIRFDDTDSDSDWDEVWDARVAETSRGWTAEIKIPLRILRFGADPTASATWGLEVRRYTSKLRETDEWAYIPREAAGEVSRYGRLEGVGTIHSDAFLELRPFVLGRLDRSDPGTETLREGVRLGASAGLDAKWHARSDLTLDLSVLPDFAQVEADRLLLNLTNEEIRLPEKRPFFFEGRDVFATPLPLLYTRRIGRISPPAPELGAGEALVDPTKPATLLGAAKLAGRIREGLRVATLEALTQDNEVDVQAPSGIRSARPLEPRTLYQALRLRQELPGNTTAGLFASSVVRSEDTARALPRDQGLVVCPDGTRVAFGARCTHDGYVGAMDARWRSEDGAYTASAALVGSALREGPARTLRDGTRIASGDWGVGGIATVAKQGGVPWIFDATYEGRSKKLDYNDLGYMPRQNLHSFEANLEYRTLRDWFVTRETHSRLELFGRANTDGLVLAHGYQLNTSFRLPSFWEVFVEAHYRGRRFDDREVGDGTALERRELVGLEVEVESDPRRAISGEISTQTQKIFDGFYFECWTGLVVRAFPQLEVSLGPNVIYTSGEPRFTGRDGARLLFGKLEATELSTTLRATYTFTPRLSLQGYAQTFLAYRHYSDFSFFDGGGGPSIVVRRRDLVPMAPPGTNPDSTNAALNMNVVLRWEYSLGSTLFFVYTRTQSPQVDLGPGQRGGLDFGGLERAPATDTVLVKLTYFLG